MDLGIQLSEKTDGFKNIDKMIDEINEVVSEYGFKVLRYNDWDRFIESCADEYEFMIKLVGKEYE